MSSYVQTSKDYLKDYANYYFDSVKSQIWQQPSTVEARTDIKEGGAFDWLWSQVKSHPFLSVSIGSYVTLAAIKKVTARIYCHNTVLELDLSTAILTDKPVSPLMKLTQPNAIWYMDLIEALKIAESDEKIKGLVVKYGQGNGFSEKLGLGQMNELRAALVAFGAKKPTVAYGSHLGLASANSIKSTSEYYLLSACKKVYIVPTGLILLPGFYLDHPFLKKTLDKLELSFQGFKREEYKTSLNIFTEDKFDEHHRKQTETLLNGLRQKIVSDIAESRGVAPDYVESWFEKGFIEAEEAHNVKIVDGLKYRDQVYDEMKSEMNIDPQAKPHFLFLTSYLEKKKRMFQKGKQVALVFAEGPITSGEDKQSFWNMGESHEIHAETLAARLRCIRKDKKIAAVVLRVESPGGDAMASDVISREVELLRKAGKKVVVSMGSVAASGGYWISAKADRIVCNPLAITGSIGVLMGKFNTRQFWGDKLGVTFDSTQTNKNAEILSNIHSFNEEQTDIMNQSIDMFYDKFKRHVAEGRGLDVERVAEIAKGQIYLGEAAHEIGLVDKVGGLMDAIKLAGELIGAEEGAIKLVLYPKKHNLAQQLLKEFAKPDNSEKREQQLASSSISATLFSSLSQLFGFTQFVQRVSSMFGGSAVLGQQASLISSVRMLHSNSNVLTYDPTVSLFSSN